MLTMRFEHYIFKNGSVDVLRHRNLSNTISQNKWGMTKLLCNYERSHIFDHQRRFDKGLATLFVQDLLHENEHTV